MKHYHISTLIKERRKELKLSLREFCLLAELSTPQHVSNIESGRQGIPISRIRKFSKALQIDFEEIIDALTADYSQDVENQVRGGANEQQI